MKPKTDPYYQHPRAFQNMNPNLVRLFRYQHRNPPLRPATWFGRALRTLARIGIMGFVALYLIPFIANFYLPEDKLFKIPMNDSTSVIYLTIFFGIFWCFIGWRLLLLCYDIHAWYQNLPDPVRPVDARPVDFGRN